MLAVSRLTAPPPAHVLAGAFSLFRERGAEPEPRPASLQSISAYPVSVEIWALMSADFMSDGSE